MRKKWLLITAILILILVSPAAEGCGSPAQENDLPVSAAIIDQLGLEHPNPDFISRISTGLENKGMDVKVYPGDEITVEFYRNLLSSGYKLIIFRVHSGLLGGDGSLAGKTWMFTNEPYNRNKHTWEQISNRVTYARTQPESPWYCAISSKFIEESTNGKLDGAIVVFMGCDSLHLTDMGDAFVKKGAAICIGWPGNVHLDYVDETTCFFIEKLCEGMTVAGAVEKTMSDKGADPEYNASMLYSPRQAGSLLLSRLLR